MSILKAKRNDGGWEEIHSVKAMTQSTNDFTQDANATANDIAEGKTAYVKGQKVTGEVWTVSEVQVVDDDQPAWNGAKGTLRTGFRSTEGRALLEKDIDIYLDIAGSALGDASTGDVLSGKTFTSANGLKLTGTYAPTTTNGSLGTPSISVAANGVITATASVSAGGYLAAGTTKNNTLTLSSAYDSDFVASNIRSGKTIFGVTGTYTGTSGVTLPTLSDPAGTMHIAKGKEAIDATGAKITGNLPLLSEMEEANGIVSTNKGAYPDDNSLWISNGRAGLYRLIDEPCYCDGLTVVGTSIDAEALGDATAADVVSGKTFTSKNGVKVTGTMPMNPVYTGTNCNLAMINNDLNMWIQDKTGSNQAIAANGYIDLYCSGDKLGDARPEDVIAGKTFTSSYGLKVAGTASAGGSNVTNFTVINSGTYETDANITSAITISHNCGVIPDAIIFMEDPVDTNMNSTTGAIAYEVIVYQPFTLSSTQYYGHYYMRYRGSSSFTSSSNTFFSGSNMITSSSFRVECTSSRKLIAGAVYKWAAIKFK